LVDINKIKHAHSIYAGLTPTSLQLQGLCFISSNSQVPTPFLST